MARLKNMPPPVALRPTTAPENGDDLHQGVIRCARAGVDLDKIDRTLIEPAARDKDEKAALWLLAWCLQPEEGAACRR
jgi:hypothetical protein